MLSCKDVTEKADDYLDENLPMLTRISFRLHLFMCVRCSRYVDQIKLTIGVLNRMQESSACSDEHAHQTLEKLKKQGGNQP